MPVNFVKEGLDAYLALTGEKRAQDKAEADLANQKINQDIAINTDKRAATSSGLQNQVSQLQIDDGTRKKDDRSRFTSSLRDFITMKTAANPSIPNSLNPAQMATSKQEAHDLAETANMLSQLPDGTMQSMLLSDLPPSAQKVLAEGPGIAAKKRMGAEHKDPVTGSVSVVTGELGPVHVVKEPGKPAVIMPTMLVKTVDPRGNVVMSEVPFTENQSNSPDDPVRTITPDMLMKRAGLQLHALTTAEQKGVSPSVAYSENIYRMVQAMPYEQQVAWMQKEIEKETSRREKHITDAETAKAAGPYAAAIQALKGTPEEKRTAATAIMLSAPNGVVDHLLKTSKSVHDMFPDSKKVFSHVETAEGVYAFDASTGQKGARIGGLKPSAKGEGLDKLPAEAKMIEYMVSGGIAPDKKTAYKMIKTSKENPKEMITKLAMAAKKEQTAAYLRPGSPGYKTDDEIFKDAKSFVDKMTSVPDEEDTPKPAKKGLSSSSPSAADFDMSSNSKPKSSFEMVNNLNF